jgi:hypothetical protein
MPRTGARRKIPAPQHWFDCTGPKCRFRILTNKPNNTVPVYMMLDNLPVIYLIGHKIYFKNYEENYVFNGRTTGTVPVPFKSDEKIKILNIPRYWK